jgi:hypothetical protein
MDDEHESQPAPESAPPPPPPPAPPPQPGPPSAPSYPAPPAYPPPAPPGYGQPHQGQPGYAQPGYGQAPPPPPGYGAPPGYAPPGYGPPGYAPPGYGPPGYGSEQRTEGTAVAALVVSIVALFVCGLIIGPVALVLATQAQKKIVESHGALTGLGMVKAARIIGIIATVLSVVGIIFIVSTS